MVDPHSDDNTSVESPAQIAKRYGLAAMGVRPPFRQYLTELWARREFLYVLADAKAKANNQNTYLGYLWAILNPLLNSLVYVLIFGILLGTREGMDNVVAFIVVGTFMYGFFSSALTSSARSIKSNIRLVQSLHFPRAVLPLASVLTELITILPAVLVMFAISQISIWKVQGLEALNPQYWLLIIPAVLLMAVFSTGLGLVMARIASRIPDLLNFLPFVIRIGMYASGVIFAIDHQLSEGTLATIMEYQPIAIYLNLARQAFTSEANIPFNASYWVIGLGWAVVMLIIGFIVFWRDEARYGRD